MKRAAKYALTLVWLSLIAAFIAEVYTYAFVYDLGVKESLMLLGENAQHALMGFGYFSFALFTLLYIVRPLVFFPASVLTITSVFLFGTVNGFIISYVGEMLSALVAYGAGKYFGEELGLDKKISHTRIGSHLHGNAFSSVFVLRLVPIFPFDVVSYASGISKLPFSSYASATLLGVLPGLSTYIFLGHSLMNTEYIVGAIMLFVLLFGLGHLAKKHLQKNTRT